MELVEERDRVSAHVTAGGHLRSGLLVLEGLEGHGLDAHDCGRERIGSGDDVEERGGRNKEKVRSWRAGRQQIVGFVKL